MALQLGDQIIDHFKAPEFGGKNVNGVEIDFLFISTETTSNWDNSLQSVATNNGFQTVAIDATNNRSENIRAGFSFFRGVAMTGAPGSLSFRDRRRIVVIDNTDSKNPVIRHNDLPLDSGALGAANITAIRAAINSATPGTPGITFESWAGGYTFPAGQEGELADADGDCASNLEEFFAGTHPVDLASKPTSILESTTEGFIFRYHAANDRTGISQRLQTGSLDNFTDFIPAPEDRTVTPVSDTIDEISVLLPPDSALFIRQIISRSP